MILILIHFQNINRNIHHTHNINSNTNTIQYHPSVNTLDEINYKTLNLIIYNI